MALGCLLKFRIRPGRTRKTGLPAHGPSLSVIIISGINCSSPPLLSLPPHPCVVAYPICHLHAVSHVPSPTSAAQAAPRAAIQIQVAALPPLDLASPSPPGHPPLVWRSLIRAGWSGSLPSLEQRLSSPGATGLELIRPAGSCREP